MSLSPAEEVAVGEKGWVDEGREGKNIPGHLVSFRKGCRASQAEQWAWQTWLLTTQENRGG